MTHSWGIAPRSACRLPGRALLYSLLHYYNSVFRKSKLFFSCLKYQDFPDPSAEFETKVLDKIKIEDFKKRLSDIDMKILELRAQGYTQQEIAKEVGYKVPSAVSKRIEKIAEQFEIFVGKEYGEFPDKHIL